MKNQNKNDSAKNVNKRSSSNQDVKSPIPNTTGAIMPNPDEHLGLSEDEVTSAFKKSSKK